MKRNKFLNRLKIEGKLEIVEPSEEIYKSYSEKSINCEKSAKLLLENRLYENSISMSYYAMYNLLLALLYKVGIKCENHTGSIFLLKLLFEKSKLSNIISDAKKERIDKQYYVTTDKDEVTKEIAEELVNNSEEFILKVKTVINNLNNEEINRIREAFQTLVD